MQMKKDASEEALAGSLKMAASEAAEWKQKSNVGDIEAWDYSKEDTPYYVTSAKSKLVREAKENRQITPSEVVLKIFHALVYLALIGEMIALAFICIQNQSLILYNLSDLKWIWIGVAGVLLLDSLLVNLFFEMHPGLCVVAVVLPFLYPALRSNCVGAKHGIGTLTSFVYFLSLCFTLGCVWTAYVNYGNLLTMEDRTLQSRIVNALDMQLGNGKNLGEFLKKKMDDEKISFQEDYSGSFLRVEGKGEVYLQDDGFVNRMTKDVPTVLLFQIVDGRTLKLSEVTIRDEELTEAGLKNYWEWVTKY